MDLHADLARRNKSRSRVLHVQAKKPSKSFCQGLEPARVAQAVEVTLG